MHSDGSRPQDSVWEVCEAVCGRTVFTALLYIRTLKKQSTDPAGTVFFECKIFLFDLLKMCFNNRNCHHGELEYYSQIGIHSTL